jgi:phenylacetic acid degradation operon negative regulatory protein
MLSFLGYFLLDQPNRDYVSSGVFIDVFGPLGVSESATRTVLNRMVRSGLLDRVQDGRVASFGITAQAETLLRQGRARVLAEQPFTQEGDNWTLLSYSIPELRRDLRHQLRSQLQWAGFGRLRDGLWIAPGAVDIQSVVGPTESVSATTFAFAGRPIGGTRPGDFVRTAWDLDYIRSEHCRFIAKWADRQDPYNPVAAYTALGADWLRLLRIDPGLPADYLPADWPAERSVAVHAASVSRFAADASETLDRMIASRAGRK